MAYRSLKWDLQEDQNQATSMALVSEGTQGTVTISANLILSLHKKQPQFRDVGKAAEPELWLEVQFP